MENKKMTYEEYRAEVKMGFCYYWDNLTDEEVEDYFKREGEALVKERYNTDIEAYNKGEIPFNVLIEGCPASVAYCLQLMYE